VLKEDEKDIQTYLQNCFGESKHEQDSVAAARVGFNDEVRPCNRKYRFYQWPDIWLCAVDFIEAIFSGTENTTASEHRVMLADLVVRMIIRRAMSREHGQVEDYESGDEASLLY
jgi:hypothetical protein